MANLLQKASIVLTPTAYDNGKVLCAKPSEAPYGDFQFSRNSAATRVNAQGLVENVQILSSNLVQNGDFSEEGVEEVSNGSFSQEGSELVTNGDFATDSDWGLQTGWSISGGSLNAVNTNGIAFQSSLGLVIGKTYKVSLNTSNYVSGSARLKLGGSAYQNISTTDSFQEFYFIPTSNTDNIIFSYLSTFTGSIDNVSVREVGQDWTLGTGWSIGEDKAVATNSPSGQKVRQLGQLTAGKTYKLVYEVTEITIGGFLPVVGAVAGTAVYSIGTYTEYITTINDDFYIRALGTTSGSITNISVKEVGMDWEFNSTAILTANGMNIITGGFIRQDVVTIGKSYKLTYDIVSYTSGNIRVYDGTDQGSIPTSVGSNTFNFTAGGSVFIIQSNSANVNLVITNISVIEITDDTNLPRINYEGFSYQDALGSELVTNGDFATDSDWILSSGSTISGGSLNIIAAPYNANTRQTISLTSGKTYKIVIKATAIGSATDNTFQLGFGDLSGNPSDTTQYEFEVGYSVKTLTVTASATDATIIFRSRDAGTSNLSIDNVSVKEYLGQEVVPGSGCGSWLFEPQSTNLITYSENFSQWTDAGTTTVLSNITNPSGGLQSYLLSASSSATNALRYDDSFSASTNYSYSLFLKAGTSQEVRMQIYDGSSFFRLAVNPLNNFEIVDQSGVNSYLIEDFTNGWKKVSINITTSASASSGYLQIYPDRTGNLNNVYIYGAQLEEQSYATSYIPTSGSTVTRNQDVCTNGGSLASINSTEGTLYAQIAALASESISKRISISDGTLANRITLSLADNVISGFVNVNNVTTYTFYEAGQNITNFNKIAIKYKQNNFCVFINGLQYDIDTNGSTFPANTLNTISFSGATSLNPFFGKTKALAVWKEALSDQELADLTYPTPTDPTFALDFDTIATDFTFARGSEATYVDAQGLIQSTASNNTPRLDYSTGAEAFLLEPQSTNIQKYSTTLSTNWLVTGTGVVTYNNAISPDGTNNATYFSAPASSSKGLYNQLPVSTSTYTASVWAKSKGLGNDKFQLGEGSGTGTGTVGEFTATSEWQRFEITGTTISGGRPVGIFQPIDFSAMDILFWGYQYEEQSYATSYIPTNGEANGVTRNQETCINATPEINSEEGVLYMEIAALADDSSERFLSISDGTSANRISLWYYSAANGLAVAVYSGNSAQFFTTTVLANDTNFNKIAISYAENDFALWINGIEISTDTSGITPIGLNELAFDRGDGNLPFFGNTKDVQVYTKALSDAELIKLTSWTSFIEMANALNYNII